MQSIIMIIKSLSSKQTTGSHGYLLAKAIARWFLVQQPITPVIDCQKSPTTNYSWLVFNHFSPVTGGCQDNLNFLSE